MVTEALIIPNSLSDSRTSASDGYHGGRLVTDAQSELIAHNERITRIIPAQQLLVYELGEGWERLANFLGV